LPWLLDIEDIPEYNFTELVLVDPMDHSCPDDVTPNEYFLIAAILLIAVSALTIATLLIHGIRTSQPSKMRPWMIMQSILGAGASLVAFLTVIISATHGPSAFIIALCSSILGWFNHHYFSSIVSVNHKMMTNRLRKNEDTVNLIEEENLE